MTEQEQKAMEDKAFNELTNTILQPISNAEFKEQMKQLSEVCEIANQYKKGLKNNGEIH